MDKNVRIKIKSSEGIWEISCLETALVKDVLERIGIYFGYAKDGWYTLHLENGVQLELDNTLLDYLIEDGDTLTFSDNGWAV